MNLATIVRSIFGMTSIPTPADLQQVVEQARADVCTAEAAVAKAKAALDRDFFALTAKPDDVAVSRLRRAVRSAQDELADRREDLARAERALAAAEAIEAQAAEQALWSGYEQLLDEHVAHSAELDACIAQLAKLFQRMGESTTAIKQAAPQRRRDWPAPFTLAMLQRLIEMRLFAQSDGLWRTPAATLETASTARAQPTLKARAEKDRGYLLAARPTAQPEPPQAA